MFELTFICTTHTSKLPSGPVREGGGGAVTCPQGHSRRLAGQGVGPEAASAFPQAGSAPRFPVRKPSTRLVWCFVQKLCPACTHTAAVGWPRALLCDFTAPCAHSVLTGSVLSCREPLVPGVSRFQRPAAVLPTSPTCAPGLLDAPHPRVTAYILPLQEGSARRPQIRVCLCSLGSGESEAESGGRRVSKPGSIFVIISNFGSLKGLSCSDT